MGVWLCKAYQKHVSVEVAGGFAGGLSKQVLLWCCQVDIVYIGTITPLHKENQLHMPSTPDLKNTSIRVNLALRFAKESITVVPHALL